VPTRTGDKMKSRKDIVELSLQYRKLAFMHATMIKKRHHKIKIRKKKNFYIPPRKNFTDLETQRERERSKVVNVD
jgi:hypothetical protein